MRGILATLQLGAVCVFLSWHNINVKCATLGDRSFQPISSKLDGPDHWTWADRKPHRNLLSLHGKTTALLPSVWEAILDAGINPDGYNVSADCGVALRYYSQGFERREPWAVRMSDSSGKQAPGMMMGGLTQFGNYDECLNSHHYPELERNRTAGGPETQYCSIYLAIPAWMAEFFGNLDTPYPTKLARVTVDLCLPRTCTTSDLHALVSQYLSREASNITLEDEVNCFQLRKFLEDPYAISFTAVMGVLLLFVFMGTCVDLVRRMNESDVVSGPVTEVGARDTRRMSRLSRFSISVYRRLKRIGSVQDHELDHDKEQSTDDHNPSFIRRLSTKIIGRRSDRDNTSNPSHSSSTVEAAHAHGGAVGRPHHAKGGEAARSVSQQGSKRSSCGIPSGESCGAQLMYMRKISSEDEGLAAGTSVDAARSSEGGPTTGTKQQVNGIIPAEPEGGTTRPAAGVADDLAAKPPDTAVSTKMVDVHLNNSAAHDDFDLGLIRSGPDRSNNSLQGHDNGGFSDVETFRGDNAEESGEAEVKDVTVLDEHANVTPEFDSPERTTDAEDRDFSVNEKATPVRGKGEEEAIHSEAGRGSQTSSVDEGRSGNEKSADSSPSKEGRGEAEGKDGDAGPAYSTMTTGVGAAPEGSGTPELSPESAPAKVSANCREEASDTKVPENPLEQAPQNTAQGASQTSDEQSAQASDRPSPGCWGGEAPEPSRAHDFQDHNERTPQSSPAASPVKSASAAKSGEASARAGRLSREAPHNQSAPTRPTSIEAHSDTSSPLARSRSLQTSTPRKTHEEADDVSEPRTPIRVPSLVTITEEASRLEPQSPLHYEKSRHHHMSKTFHSHHHHLDNAHNHVGDDAAHSRHDHNHKHDLNHNRNHNNNDNLTESFMDGEHEEGIPTPSPANLSAMSSEMDIEAGRSDAEEEKKEKEKEQEKERKHGLLVEVLLCFSFVRGVRRVVAEGNPDQLFSLNGVRVLSICWIVLGNTMAMLNNHSQVLANKVDMAKMGKTMWFQAIMNGTFAADTFFILSGCLLCFHFTRAKVKLSLEVAKPNAKTLLLFYFHRFMRIMPCFLVALLSYTTLLPYFGNGPYWSSTEHAIKECRAHWWANALFFSNFYKADQMCMPWSYYLVNDFQMYLLSPLILYPLLFYPAVGLLLIVLLVALQIVATTFLVSDLNGNLLSLSSEFFEDVYSKPYCRVAPFVMGIALGHFLYHDRTKVFFQQIPLILSWLASLSVVGAAVYATYGMSKEGAEQWTVVEYALFQALARPAWSLAVCAIIFFCNVGQGGFVNKFLSWNSFLPLCRTTYGVYLLHPILLSVVFSSSRYPIYVDFVTLMYYNVSTVVCSYGLSFFLITLVECPFTSLEALLRARL